MKKHWWDKLKYRWDGMTVDEKKFVKRCMIVLGIGSGAIGAAIGSTVTNHYANKDIAEITDFAGKECCRAYDQGVFDGATNPGLLKNLKDLNRI